MTRNELTLKNVKILLDYYQKGTFTADEIISRITFLINEEREFLKDCESICYDCAGTFLLKRHSEGIAVCLWCRFKEWLFFGR